MTGPLLQRERVRFHDFQFERLPDGRCRAKVDLAWTEDRHYVGEADGVGSETGELRCAALATVDALTTVAAGHEVRFRLLGVKAVRAFDAIVVIVALAARAGDRNARLVGSYLTEADAPRGAALAVLNATNRFLGNLLARTS